jgi:signal peptidase I
MMQGPSSAPTEPIQRGTKKTYNPWVGVILSVLVTGTGQFLAGKKKRAFQWFLGLTFLNYLSIWCLGTAHVPGILPGLSVAAACLVLWLVMLVNSYAPVRRLNPSGWLLFVVLFLGISFATQMLAGSFFQPFGVPTSTMEPTLKGSRKSPDGKPSAYDRIFVEKYAYWRTKPKRGDIVVFRTEKVSPQLTPGEFYVKRIVGIPGDVLTVKDGHLLNHGAAVESPPFLKQIQIVSVPGSVYLGDEKHAYKVPENSYFVLGDNTANSRDSRAWGPVPQRAIVGRVSKIYWPWSRIGKVQ